MRFTGLDGKEHNISLTKYLVEGSNKSGPHMLARKLIKQLYGVTPVCEELQIPGTLLRLDFYICHHKIAVEVQGDQHEEFNEHFHRTRSGFKKALARDSSKDKWCQINNIQLVKLYDGESEEKWLEQLTKF